MAGTAIDRSEGGRTELIAVVFPEMRYGEDPDLERYLELRRGGKVTAALGLYNGPLRLRYPDDGSRIQLISLRRANDPRWRGFQARLLDELAGRLEIRARANMDAILGILRSAAFGDAYGSLRAVDTLLRHLNALESPDRALELVERHLRIARIIEDGLPAAKCHRSRGLERAADLLREYSSLSRMENVEEQDFVARSLALEERRRGLATKTTVGARHDLAESPDFIARSKALEEAKRAGKQGGRHFFDLEKLRFSAKDRALIELDSPPGRHEDLVLAYCLKYWRLSLDASFERTVFLYSRKYGTRHFELFRELRMGRLRGRSDDELLTALSSLLSSGYSYSITGDIYMQRRWRLLKTGLYEEEKAALGVGEEVKVMGRKPSPPRGVELPPAAPAAPVAPLPSKRPAVSLKPEQRPAPPVTRVAKPVTAAPGVPAAANKPSRAKTAAPAFTPREASPRARLVPARVAAEPIGAIEAKTGGSISDRIRRLSGRQYDVYRIIFLEKVRDAIRGRLLALRDRPAAIFDTSANEAEDIIYAYMASKYDDPFMDWETAPERLLVERLGYRVSSLDGIIEDCYRRL
jgi:hypothetical protein